MSSEGWKIGGLTMDGPAPLQFEAREQRQMVIACKACGWSLHMVESPEGHRAVGEWIAHHTDSSHVERDKAKRETERQEYLAERGHDLIESPPIGGGTGPYTEAQGLIVAWMKANGWTLAGQGEFDARDYYAADELIRRLEAGGHVIRKRVEP